jgi:hypothetical protein
MSSVLEFAAPVSPSLIGMLNRNPRKFRILQYKTEESEGLLPLIVGTYSVDLTTGQPLVNNGNAPPNDVGGVSGTLAGSTEVIQGFNTGLEFGPSVYDVIMSTDTAQTLGFGFGPIGSPTSYFEGYFSANSSQKINLQGFNPGPANALQFFSGNLGNSSLTAVLNFV